MRYFELTDQIKQDPCAIEAKNKDQQAIEDYYLMTHCHMSKTHRKKAMDIVLNNRNIRLRDGHGVANGDVIDHDSKIKYNSEMTNSREKKQFGVRTFHGCPNMSRGTLLPNIEHELVTGSSTLHEKQCSFKFAEVDYNRFVPLNECVENFYKTESMTIPEFHTIGQSSKDILRAQRGQKCNLTK